jgi:DNA-binding response OmpR family regulator
MNCTGNVTRAARILIAEDNAHLRNLFGKVLRNAGFEVILASDGSQVLEHIQDDLPEAIILDLGMPGASGQQIIHMLRQQQGIKNVRIVVVTGNHLAVDSAEADMADLFLVKPISTHDLVRFVHRLVKQ